MARVASSGTCDVVCTITHYLTCSFNVVCVCICDFPNEKFLGNKGARTLLFVNITPEPAPEPETKTHTRSLCTRTNTQLTYPLTLHTQHHQVKISREHPRFFIREKRGRIAASPRNHARSQGHSGRGQRTDHYPGPQQPSICTSKPPPASP